LIVIIDKSGVPRVLRGRIEAMIPRNEWFAPKQGNDEKK
jgi:hypothetical protein